MLTQKRITSIFLLVAVLLFTFLFPALASNKLKTHFINVGQGDSILVQLPNNQNLLIDAGGNDDETLVVNYLKNQGIDNVDYLIGTHPHEDHIGGLDKVISSFKIGKIYMPNVTHTTQTYKDVLISATLKNKEIIPSRAGINLINTNDLQVKLIGQ